MLIFIIFMLVIIIGGYYAFRYAEQTPPPRKIANPNDTFEFNQELAPEANPEKKTVNYAYWEDDPPIYLNIKHPHIHLLLKDPNWLFCYWHWGANTREQFNQNHGEQAWDNSAPVIRYFELNNGLFIDIPVNNYSHTWYIKVYNRHTPIVLYLGRLVAGRFIRLAASNVLIVPLGKVSPEVDPSWLPIGRLPGKSTIDSGLDLGGMSSLELIGKK